jgi:spore coat protein H
MRSLAPAALALGVLAAVSARSASAQNWPAVFEPTQVLSLNLQIDPADWQTIQDDDTFDIEVPATFWADGDTPITVSIRRKSAVPLQNGTPFRKVAYKIDFDEFVDGQSWRSLRKLSLENGAESDVVSEGIAWHLNRLASGPEGYGYQHPSALAAWVRVTINGQYNGVYLSVEQRDKRMLQNRGLWVEGQSWFYEVEDPDQIQIEAGDGLSPTVNALCYVPFAPPGGCPTPSAATLAAELPTLVNMRSLLTLAACDTLMGNPDGIFSHAKNFFFADYTYGPTRMYFPWDLDAIMGGNAGSIYATPTPYASVLLGVPEFRAQYSQILRDLICGPASEASVHAFLDAIEPVLTGPLSEDPNSLIEGSIAGFFDGRRAWISDRWADIAAEIEGFTPCGTACPADWNGDDDVNSLDISAFITSWLGSVNSPNLVADFNGDSVVNSGDISAFITAWLASLGGC